jgi:rhodanese-related sulfurtransferase
VKVISTDEAEALLGERVPFVDVRTPAEFAAGHVPGAINVPIALPGGAGFTPNPEFASVMTAIFAPTEPLIVACKAGGRSAQAAALLTAQGFLSVHDMSAGFEGGRDSFGRPLPGWSQEGREIELEADPEQTYEGALALASSKSAQK